MAEYRLSPLGKTWLLDLDGTLLKHNGYKLDGEDSFLDGAKKFLKQLPAQDKIILLTSRTREQCVETESFLRVHGVHYEALISDLPYGERILVNDAKPSGLVTAIAINTVRDQFMQAQFLIDENL